MRRPLAFVAGGLAVIGLLRRRREPPVEVEDDGSDPRADELRRKLAEARAVEPEPESKPEPEDPQARRREVHESAHQTVEQMRRGR